MGIPKKGSRVINIEEIIYRYIISGNDGHIDLIIENETVKGQRLIVSFDYQNKRVKSENLFGEPNIISVQTNQITPSVVKQVIEYGLKNGWTPNQKGEIIRFKNIDNKLD